MKMIERYDLLKDLECLLYELLEDYNDLELLQIVVNIVLGDNNKKIQ